MKKAILLANLKKNHPEKYKETLYKYRLELPSGDSIEKRIKYILRQEDKHRTNFLLAGITEQDREELEQDLKDRLKMLIDKYLLVKQYKDETGTHTQL